MELDNIHHPAGKSAPPRHRDRLNCVTTPCFFLVAENWPPPGVRSPATSSTWGRLEQEFLGRVLCPDPEAC